MRFTLGELLRRFESPRSGETVKEIIAALCDSLLKDIGADCLYFLVSNYGGKDTLLYKTPATTLFDGFIEREIKRSECNHGFSGSAIFHRDTVRSGPQPTLRLEHTVPEDCPSEDHELCCQPVWAAGWKDPYGTLNAITSKDTGDVEVSLQVASKLLEIILKRRNFSRQQSTNKHSLKSPQETSTESEIIGDLLFKSDCMKLVIAQCKRVADADRHFRKAHNLRKCSVLFTGSTGTGKTEFARLIHELGPRKNKLFLPINAAVLFSTRDLMRGHFYGWKKGSFDSAHQDTRGALKEANGGTIFIDEIANIPVSDQVTLLTMIESNSAFPIGTSDKKEEFTYDVQFLFATNHNLMELIREKKFLLDLYYRISTFRIHLPSLRERREDIIPLFSFCWKRLNQNPPPRLDKDATNALLNYEWPGNVRELEMVVSRISANKLGAENTTISKDDVTSNFDPVCTLSNTENSCVAPSYVPHKGKRACFEKLCKSPKIESFRHSNGNLNKTKLAERFGVKWNTIDKWVKSLNSDRRTSQ